MPYKFVTHGITCVILSASNSAHGKMEKLTKRVYCENDNLAFCINATEIINFPMSTYNYQCVVNIYLGILQFFRLNFSL